MSTAVAKQDQSAIIEQVVLAGDLSRLTAAQRTDYYAKVCASVGLNPLTRPFDYINLNGKLTLYAKRDATDQLRSKHKISITITERKREDDVYIVTARAKNAEGREDESTGAVSVAGLKNDSLANAMMKAETKAKRRVTLSICGLGLLDETELETIKDARLVAENPAQIDPLAEAKKEREAIEDDPGEYVATFGKYKHQKLKDVDIYDLAGYVSYIEAEAERTGKEIKGNVATFMKHANDLIDQRKFERL